MGEWLRRAWYWLNRRRFEEALRDEMAAHRDEMAEPRRFGNTLRLRDEARDVWRLRWLEGLGRDTRVAARVLRRQPGFTITAVASLAIGFVIVGTTLGVVNAYLLRALPYPQADRLYHVRYAPPGPWEPRGLSGLDWTAVQDVVEFPLTSSGDTFYLSDGAFAETARGLRVSHAFVEALRVPAVAGRPLEASDWQNGADAVAMMGHRLWRDRYASDPSVVGRHIRVESEGRRDRPETFRIVGVLPPGFYFGRDSSARVDVLVPLTVPTRTYMVMLRAGTSPALAERRMSEAVRNTASDLPSDWAGVVLESVRERYVAELRPVLMVVSMGAGLVLLLVWTNVAVLTLLRTLRRQKEIAVRVALGSGRAALARMLALEALLVCLAALVTGLSLAHVVLGALAPVIERQLGRPAPGGSGALSIDGSIVVALGVLGGLVALSLSLLPLIGRSQRRLGDVLGRERGVASDTRVMRHTRSALVSVEVAGTLALLVGGGLMLRSVTGMVRTDLGFDPQVLARSRVILRGADYPDPQSFFRFYEQFGDRLATATAARVVFADWPFFAARPTLSVEVDGRAGQGLTSGYLRAGPGFFATAGIGLRAGRDFTRADVQSDAPVVVVSESLAARLWPDGAPIGRRLRGVEQTPSGPTPGPWRTVIGVAADTRQGYFDGQVGDVYFPLSPSSFGRFGSFYLRTTQPPASLTATVRATAAAIDPRAMIDEVSAVASQNQELEGAEFLTTMLGGVAGAAMFLAVIGIYGVTAYTVQQRARDTAIRLALGATPRSVRRLFLKDCVITTSVGLLLGLLVTAALSSLLESWVYGVPARDPGTMALAAALLAAICLLSAWWPSRRGSNQNPMSALKEG